MTNMNTVTDIFTLQKKKLISEVDVCDVHCVTGPLYDEIAL